MIGYLVCTVFSSDHLLTVCKHELMVLRHKLSTAGWCAFSVAGPSVWNSKV